MNATLILADYAQVAEGKLTIVGGGWNVTGPGPLTFGIAMDIEVPWDRANIEHTLRLELLDADGQPVALDDNEGPVALGGTFEVGRPPGHPHGAPLSHKFAVNFGVLPVPPGRRWTWRLLVNDEPVAVRSFQTRPAQ